MSVNGKEILIDVVAMFHKNILPSIQYSKLYY